MFILECDCGNEVFCNEEDATLAWQCEVCGQWYNLFGGKIPAPNRPAAPPQEFYYEPDEDEEE